MFNLTKEERQAVLFLAMIALAGTGIKVLIKQYAPTKTAASFTQDIGKIDLNSADKDLLMTVSGIGEKTAQRIIEYRQAHQGFHDLEELKDIAGITDYRYGKIKHTLIIE